MRGWEGEEHIALVRGGEGEEHIALVRGWVEEGGITLVRDGEGRKAIPYQTVGIGKMGLWCVYCSTSSGRLTWQSAQL